MYTKGGAILGFSTWQKKENAVSRFFLGLSWAGQFKIYVYLIIILLAPTQHAIYYLLYLLDDYVVVMCTCNHL